jgi:cysteine desulfurase/selenocysteine lyase
MIDSCRKDFPIFQQPYHGNRLAFLDNGASTQKPRAVINAMVECQEEYYSNVHRGAYELSVRSTEASEALRLAAANRLNAPVERNKQGQIANIIYVRGATEAINLVAQSWGRTNLKKGDVILLSQLEHHANIIPWHILAEELRIKLVWVPVKPEDGRLDMRAAKKLVEENAEKLRLIAVSHVSNVLGTINDVMEFTRMAHSVGALCLVDGAQSMAHLEVDIQEVDCDFYTYSGHKMYGPTGIGVLYIRAELAEQMPAWMGGGGMISEVREDGWSALESPAKFEAGTPAIVQEIGLVAAHAYLDGLAPAAELLTHEQSLTADCMDQLSQVEGLRVFGPPGDAADRIGVISFMIDGIHPHDLATILDEYGVCVRSGHHCAQPLMRALGIAASTRISFAAYNNSDDIAQLIRGLKYAQEVFS